MKKKSKVFLGTLIVAGGVIAALGVNSSTKVSANYDATNEVTYKAVPSQTPRGLRAGTEQVGGIGYIKQQIYAAGGDDIAVAVAMLETKTMDSYDDSKSGDAANFTRFNMNWYAIRTKLYPSLGADDAYKVKDEFTGSIQKETQLFMRYKSAWGGDFYKIHRGGQSGLTGGYVEQIADYQDAIEFMARQLSENPQYRSDDTRVWVEVPYI